MAEFCGGERLAPLLDGGICIDIPGDLGKNSQGKVRVLSALPGNPWRISTGHQGAGRGLVAGVLPVEPGRAQVRNVDVDGVQAGKGP